MNGSNIIVATVIAGADGGSRGSLICITLMIFWLNSPFFHKT